MTAWTSDELARIGDAGELTIQALSADGTLRKPLRIWVVRDGEHLYVRSYRGESGAWYRAARASRAGHIQAGSVAEDVTFVSVTDAATYDRIDEAYRTKYRSYGAAYIGAMTTPTARATTLELVPR